MKDITNPTKLKHHKGTPITPELKARIRAALKILTLDRFCRLADISDTTVKRALAGDRITPRCTKGLRIGKSTDQGCLMRGMIT